MGLRALELEEGDVLVGTAITDGTTDVMLLSTEGKAVRFKEGDVRAMGRTSRGVRGMRFDDSQSLISMIIPQEGGKVLTISENGYGKRTSIDEYPIQKRGGKGLAGMQTGVLGLAFWAFWAGPVQAPGSGAGLFGALASSDDASRIPLHARFDRKTRHVAESWRLFGDLQQEDATGTRAEDAAEAEALVAHARAAVQAGPASGHAWLALAWTTAKSGSAATRSPR